MPSPSAPGYPAPALEKGLDILELLGRQRESLTLSAIGAALGRSRGEIFRVVRTLEARGYLTRRGDGDRYSLTNRMFLVGARRPRFATLTEVAVPVMRALTDAISLSCHLTVPADGRTVVIARAENPHAISMAVPLGHNLPFPETASGRAFLAFLPPDERAARLAESPAASRRKLAARLDRIRARGHEIAPSIHVSGVTDISFPIVGGEGRPIAFVGVPYLRDRVRGLGLERTLAAIRGAAARIAAELAAQAVPVPGARRPRQPGAASAGSSAR